jgi:pimeloyl-ACP methyl ester carboxylesterase
VLDLPGFGGTQLPPEPWTAPDYACWIVQYLDQAHLHSVFLIGHSFGGRIGLVLGADYPERVRKIVLSNSAGVRLPPSLKLRLYAVGRRVLLTILCLPGLDRAKQRVKTYLRRKFGSPDYLRAGPLTETFKRVVNQDLTSYARRVQAPTLLFWGDRDMETPLAAGRVLEREMPDAALILFGGAGHFAYLDDLPRFLHIAGYFFAQGSATTDTARAEGDT